MNVRVRGVEGECEIRVGPYTTPKGVTWAVVKLPDGRRLVVEAQKFDVLDQIEFRESWRSDVESDILRLADDEVRKQLDAQIVRSLLL